MENSKHIAPVEVVIIKDGPVKIKGDFIFTDSSGESSEEYKEVYICRCGGSGNKPFCDGTHKKILHKK